MAAWEKHKHHLTRLVSEFETIRYHYELCPSKTGFFQPFKTASDVHQQIKTTLVSPVMGLFSIVPNLIKAIQGVLVMAISIPCLSPDLFITGLVETVAALAAIIITPLVALAVTLASLVSLITRTIATCISYNGGEISDDWLSFLPDNPYKHLQDWNDREIYSDLDDLSPGVTL